MGYRNGEITCKKDCPSYPAPQPIDPERLFSMLRVWLYQ
jgi:hypothetical protein